MNGANASHCGGKLDPILIDQGESREKSGGVDGRWSWSSGGLEWNLGDFTRLIRRCQSEQQGFQGLGFTCSISAESSAHLSAVPSVSAGLCLP